MLDTYGSIIADQGIRGFIEKVKDTDPGFVLDYIHAPEHQSRTLLARTLQKSDRETAYHTISTAVADVQIACQRSVQLQMQT